MTMTRKAKQASQTRPADARRRGWRSAGMFLLAVIAVVVDQSGGKAVAAAGLDPSKLIGRWMRSDGGYVLELSKPAQDGQLTAAYFNPRPINVSRATWKLQSGRLSVFVELRDVNYPGSTYTLDYHAATDRLVGIYFQAVLRQEFAVQFERAK